MNEDIEIVGDCIEDELLARYEINQIEDEEKQ